MFVSDMISFKSLTKNLRLFHLMNLCLGITFSIQVPESIAQPKRGLGSLRGSPASLDRQQIARRRSNLKLHPNKRSVRRAIRRNELKRIRPTRKIELSNVSYPYAHPKLYALLHKLSSLYWQHCRTPLVITSLLRPRNEQPRNASPRSVHPSGIAVDLRVPPKVCRHWLRETLSSWERQHFIEATREYRPPHFHVVVLPHRLSFNTIKSLRGGGKATKTLTARRSTGHRKTHRSPLVRYKVKRGDSLWGLSRRWGVSQKEIMRRNRLSSTRIDRGQMILIPKSK